MSRNLRPLSSSIYNPRFTSIINLWKVQGKFSRKVKAENRKFRDESSGHPLTVGKFRTPTNLKERTEQESSGTRKFRTPTNCGKVPPKVQDTH
jgi:adenine specific DNA methylase Mod